MLLVVLCVAMASANAVSYGKCSGDRITQYTTSSNGVIVIQSYYENSHRCNGLNTITQQITENKPVVIEQQWFENTKCNGRMDILQTRQHNKPTVLVQYYTENRHECCSYWVH